jgi:ATP-dependent protease ClpP protease subunit
MEQTPTNKSWYSITAKGEDEVEIRIYEDIGFYGVSAKSFADALEAVPAQTIHIRLNTYGGEAFDGIAIHNALQAHPARVVVHVDGIAASAGSIIAMAGDEIRMADNAFLMIHEARGGVMGEADDMRQYADVLDKLNDSIALTYQKRGGKTRQYWRNAMAEESWYSADEAKAVGLADSVDVRAESAKNRFDFKIYNHVKEIPARVKAAWGAPPKTATLGHAMVVLPAGCEVTQVQAPESSQSNEAPESIHKEISTMENPTNAAPAQAPAAASNGSVPQVNPVEREIAQLNTDAVAGYIREGYDKGVEDGDARAVARFLKLMDAAPGNPAIVAKAFLSNQSPESVKLAFDAANEAVAIAQAAATEELLLAKKENARLHKVLGTGGHAGVSMQVAQSTTDPVRGMSPKAQAEWEWDNRPSVREGITAVGKTTAKEIYVLAREAELAGNHRSFKRETASVN